MSTNDTRAVLEGLRDRLTEAINQLPDETPAVPDRIETWPMDETHLRGEFWKDRDGDTWGFIRGFWKVWKSSDREWVVSFMGINHYAPYVRTTDPSLPQTWDKLADVPEDVERVRGIYCARTWTFARSPLPGSGWFVKGLSGYWVEATKSDVDAATDIKEDES